MKLRIFAIATFCTLLFSGLCMFGGCTVTPSTPQQSIYQIKSNYADALSAAVIYDGLPSCAAAVPGVLCAEAGIKNKLKQAKDIASPAIQAAENAVRDPSFDKSTADAVVAAARQAVLALTTIIAQLPVPKSAAKPTGAVMTALPAAHESALGAIAVLGLLSQLLSLVPQGSALWEKFSAQKTKVQAMVDEGRNPTDAEWAALDAEVNALEQQVNDGATAG